MSSLPILYLPANSSAIPSTIGARTLHGPHHVAVKSTRTGTLDLRTSASKLASVSSITFLPAITGLLLIQTWRNLGWRQRLSRCELDRGLRTVRVGNLSPEIYASGLLTASLAWSRPAG